MSTSACQHRCCFSLSGKLPQTSHDRNKRPSVQYRAVGGLAKILGEAWLQCISSAILSQLLPGLYTPPAQPWPRQITRTSALARPPTNSLLHPRTTAAEVLQFGKWSPQHAASHSATWEIPQPNLQQLCRPYPQYVQMPQEAVQQTHSQQMPLRGFTRPDATAAAAAPAVLQ